ncbi:MAG: hypothetical protein ACOYUZ_01165 [Patescibacteria group bacterium]
MKLTYFLAIALVLAFLGAGCSNSNNELRTTNLDIGKGGNVNPCDLIDQGEIDALFGKASTIIQDDKEPINPTGQKLCVYDAESDYGVTMAQIGVQQSKDMVSGMTAEDLFESQKEFLEGIADVQGLGDGAYQTSAEIPGGGALYFLAENKTVLITVDISLGRLDNEANQKAERDIAAKIMEQL